MPIRATLLALVFALGGATAAGAQQAPAPSAATPAPSPSAAAAGGDVVRALMFGTGLMDAAIEGIDRQMMPDLRTSMTNSPLYRSLRPAHREALMAFIDTMPQIVREEVTTEMGPIAERAGPRLAALMSEDSLVGIAAFLRSPEARPFFTNMAQIYMAQDPDNHTPPPVSSYSDDDIRTVAAFMQTPAGIAFTRNADAINDILREEFDAATVRMMPRAQARLMNGMCAAMGNECPAQMRRQID